MQPIYQERVWGGRKLAGSLGRQLPEGPIGESWEIVDRPEADSPVTGSGQTLSELRSAKAGWLMGPDWPAERPFPILVKWLDCRERLSLQVHPPADVAPRLGGEPKTENWYIVEAEEGAALLAGLREGVTREAFAEALQQQRLEPLLGRLPATPGNSLFVRSGRLHAIDAGNLILEIQQNSDTTCRVYDWGRTGLDGKPRQLHVDESMASIDFADVEPKLLYPSGKECVLADAEEFRLRRLELAAGEQIGFAAGEQPRILSVVSGRLQEADGGVAERGDNLVLPYAEASSWTAKADAVVLITDQFNR
jgi:mannose-6-phosphate isomerase